MMAAAIMAETSDQALMRHQYQRSRYTAPVPAPTPEQELPCSAHAGHDQRNRRAQDGQERGDDLAAIT